MARGCCTFPLAASTMGTLLLLLLLRFARADSVLSAIEYGWGHVSTSGSTVSIRMDRGGGAEVCTQHPYMYGTFSAYIRCPEGDTSGFSPSFYTRVPLGNGKQDEIDIEFFGNRKHKLQTNYYGNGHGGHEDVTDLGFDCSADFHKYTIHWTSSSIKWLVDGEVIRTVYSSDDSPYPRKAGYLCASIWDASQIASGHWMGKANYADSPYFFKLQDVYASSGSD